MRRIMKDIREEQLEGSKFREHSDAQLTFGRNATPADAVLTDLDAFRMADAQLRKRRGWAQRKFRGVRQIEDPLPTPC